ncbi:hypothetical protein ACMA1I_16075 [Pontibacter sp. 13R65]|uniref:hypothetical protein n=1 Tax=Pontibacter sp. 13R65 TaxID=3127458 RepID=UPI00301B6FA8
MGNFSKSALLLFLFFFLSLAGEGEGWGISIAQAVTDGTDKGYAPASLSDNRQHKIQVLFKPSENAVSAVNLSFPTPGAKNQLSGLVSASPAVEHYLHRLNREYLFRAKGICLSLGNCDIIFPFHYFW